MSCAEAKLDIGDLVMKVPEVIPSSTPHPPPTTRSPFIRLREKIVRGSNNSTGKEGRPFSTASVSTKTGDNNVEVISSNEDSEGLPPHQAILDEDPRNDIEEKTTISSKKAVPVSANIDKKRGAVDSGQGSHLQEIPFDRPGAFQVAGMDNGSNNDEDEDDVAPSVSSVIMNGEDPPIPAELVFERKQLEPIEVKRINDGNSWLENHWKECICLCIIAAVAVCLSISLTNAKTKTLVLIELEDICTYVNDREPWLRGAVSANGPFFIGIVYTKDSQFSAFSWFSLGIIS